jgi:predicted dehydrogenase
VALVGCGAAAEWYHLPALRRLVDADDLWFVDADLERARGLAGRDDRAATEVPEVEAAIVAVPNDLHVEVAAPLLARGVRVLCEKPLARTVAEAEQLRAAAVGNVRRLFPTTRLVADLLERGLCGRPLSVSAEEGFVYGWTARTGFSLDAERAGGGVLLDIGTHVLDQLAVWLGALEVTAYRDDAHGGLEADCVVELRAGAVPVSLELSRTRHLRNTAVISCETGSIEAPLAQPGTVVVELAGGRGHALDAGGSYEAAFEEQLRAFLAGTPAASGEDGLAAVALVEAAYARREPLPEPWTTATLAPR